MKRIFLIILVLYSSILIESCNQNQSKSTDNTKEGFYPEVVKVGHLVALDMAPLFLAKELGYFKEEGIDIETVFFSNPGDNNAALAGGSIKFSTNPFTLPYFAANSGIPMKIISTAGGIGIMQVIIQGSFNVETIEQLVKYIKAHPNQKLRIGVLKGDTLEMIVYKILTNNGLSYNDVEMIWFNDLLAMVQSFETKQIDILSHIKPYTTNFIVNHGAKALSDNSQVWGYGSPNCTVAVMDEFYTKYPKTVKAYLRGLYRGFKFYIDNPEEAAEILDKGHYYKVDKNVLIYAFKNQPKQVVLKPEGMQAAIDDMVTAKYIDKPKTDIVKLEILNDVLNEFK